MVHDNREYAEPSAKGLNGVPFSSGSGDSLLRRILKRIFPILDAPFRFSLPDDSPFQDSIRKMFPAASVPLQQDGIFPENGCLGETLAQHYGAFGRVFFSASGRLSRSEFFRAAGITLLALQMTALLGAALLAIPLWFVAEYLGSIAAFIFSSIPIYFYIFLYGRPLFCILTKRLHDAGIRFWGRNACLCLALILLPVAAYFLNPWLCLAAHPALALLVLPWPGREP